MENAIVAGVEKDMMLADVIRYSDSGYCQGTEVLGL
jgi:hypothetical protein